MVRPLIISITSDHPQAGKDTVIAATRDLLENQGIPTARVAFGDSLKEVTLYCCQSGQLFPEIYHKFRIALEADKDTAHQEFSLNKLGKSPFRQWMLDNGHDGDMPRPVRFYLWWFGTSFMREHLGIHDVWVKMVEQKIKKIHAENPNTVIFVTDTRFPLEVSRLQQLDAHFFRVKPVGFPKSKHEEAYNASGIEGQLNDYSMGTIINKYGEFDRAAVGLVNIVLMLR